MKLVKVQVENFKSIDNSGSVIIDPGVTVLVGQNEAGKTAFLQALEKARPIRKNIRFDVTEDYPRKSLNEYRKQHEKSPAVVVKLTYQLEEDELKAVNDAIGVEVLRSPLYTYTYKYNSSSTIDFSVDEPPFVKYIVKKAKLPKELADSISSALSVREVISLLEEADLNNEGQEFLESLKQRFPENPLWNNLLAYEVREKYIGADPKFLYFGDYQLLPGKINIPMLLQRADTPTQLTEEDQTVLRLLRMADVELKDISETRGYEEAKARLEGLSNSITDQVFEYWTQNRELDVEFDIRVDPTDTPPFNSGPNLYIRIRNRRHRVTVPFSQRSKGFIWFFSFLVWFDSVLAEKNTSPIILLLDEPGLSLHALAQADLLRYIDNLSARHQVLYTTHSPFMVHGDRLHQVRLVEDREREGSIVTDNVMGSDPKTLFPLQAALGYTVAQNLFISKRNLLVEGPADLIYLKHFSNVLDMQGRTCLREDITIVPVGGLDKVATFIALLSSNQLELAVVHDFSSKPDARLESLVKEKVIRERQILNYGMFRKGAFTSKSGKGQPISIPATDVEDMFSPKLYLEIFNGTFKKTLDSNQITDSVLPPGARIVDRIERYLKDNNIVLRPSGGFNHYAVANYLASNPPQSIDSDTLESFEKLFKSVNSLYR